MLLANRFGRIPRRILDLTRYLGQAQGRGPILAPDTDGIGDNHGSLALLGFWKIIEPHLRHIDNNALSRRIRKHIKARHHYLCALPGDPRVNPGIGQLHLLKSLVIRIGQIGKGIFVNRLDEAHSAYYSVSFSR
jgi:hypothetical protein